MNSTNSSFVFSLADKNHTFFENVKFRLQGISKFIQPLNILGQFMVLNLVFFLTYYFKFGGVVVGAINQEYRILLILVNLIAMVINLVLSKNEPSRIYKRENLVIQTLKSTFTNGLLLIGILYFIKENDFSRHFLIQFYSFTAIGTMVWKLSYFRVIQFCRTHGLNYKNVVIVGKGSAAKQVQSFFKSYSGFGYRVVDVINVDYTGNFKKSDFISKLQRVDGCIDELYCAVPLNETETIREICRYADNNLIKVKLIPDFKGFFDKRVNLDYYGRIPVLSLRKDPLENVNTQIFKRVFDVVFSILVLTFIFPIVYLIVAPIIKISSKGPVFFKQKRNGLYNQEFYCYKFRTMRVNNDSDRKQASLGDTRITRIGNFLRKSNLDELPQFYNVLLGNMSVIGPRPHMTYHTQKYSQIVEKYMVRHLVKPGITGWAQINGYRGETKDLRRMHKRVQYDIWYIENYSSLLDFRILFITIYKIIIGDKYAF